MPAYRLLQTRHFEQARDFLDALRPVEAPWCPPPGEGCHWLFRGQANAEWSLIPAVWRQRHAKLTHLRDRFLEEFGPEVEACRAEMGGWGALPTEEPGAEDRVRDLLGALYAEFAAVHAYAELADELGLMVPDYRELQAQRSRFVQRVFENGELVPNQAYAIAQHHGIPTRLLDWTRKPLAAAFFAADAARAEAEGEAIAVYAIHTAVLTEESAIRKLLIPRHLSTYLHAQAALLTWCRGGEAYFCQHGSWPTYEEVLATPAMSSVLEGRQEPVVLKYTLPRSEAADLLRLLLIEGVSRAHLMPTYDNVTRTLNAKWRA